MSKPQPFVVPEGVVFQVADDGVVVENAGDIVLHTNFGRPLKRIVSREGSVEIHAAVTGGTVEAKKNISLHGSAQAEHLHAGGNVSVHGDARATRIDAGGGVAVDGNAHVDHVDAGGTVTLRGNVQAGTVRADTIRLEGGTIAGKGFQGARAVYVGAAKLAVDAIIAPEVYVDPKTSGRVTIVESANELGPNAIKGGFRLADYAEMFGDYTAFLRDRNLAMPGEAPPPAPAAPAAEAPVEIDATPTWSEPLAAVEAQEEDLPMEEPDTATPPASVHVGPGVPAGGAIASVEVEPEPIHMEPEPMEEEEPANGHVNGHGAAEEPSASAASTIPEHPLHKQLIEAVNKIADCYGEAELPPAVSHLRELIEIRSYDKVRGEITAIWSDLLKFHQKKGLRIQHQVTTTFNTINSLVKKM